jgi:protein SCO1/2
MAGSLLGAARTLRGREIIGPMQRALIIAAVLAGIVAGIVSAALVRRAGTGPHEFERAVLYPEPRPLPGFELVDQSGRPFDAGRLRGRWTFLFFGFANCPDICPTTLATLAVARRSLADLPAPEIPGVALVSVDPGRDTPELLARYVAHFDPSFSAVTGAPGAIDELTRALGVAVMLGPAAPDGSYSVDHTAAIFLVDPEARIAALFGTPHEAAAIARDYRRILAAQRAAGAA